MRTLYIFIITLLLSVAVVPQQQNPASVWCDYHNAYFFKSGVEYPNGVCYDKYEHPVWQNGKRYVHKMSMRCP